MDIDLDEGFVDVSIMLDPAIYLLLYKGQVVYVGKARDPITRLLAHRNQKYAQGYRRKKIKTTEGLKYVSHIPHDEIFIKPCTLEEMYDLEIAFIKKYRPRYNIKHNDSSGVRVSQVQNLILPKDNWIVNLVMKREAGAHPYITGKINRRI